MSWRNIAIFQCFIIFVLLTFRFRIKTDQTVESDHFSSSTSIGEIRKDDGSQSIPRSDGGLPTAELPTLFHERVEKEQGEPEVRINGSHVEVLSHTEQEDVVKVQLYWKICSPSGPVNTQRTVVLVRMGVSQSVLHAYSPYWDSSITVSRDAECVANKLSLTLPNLISYYRFSVGYMNKNEDSPNSTPLNETGEAVVEEETLEMNPNSELELNIESVTEVAFTILNLREKRITGIRLLHQQRAEMSVVFDTTHDCEPSVEISTDPTGKDPERVFRGKTLSLSRDGVSSSCTTSLYSVLWRAEDAHYVKNFEPPGFSHVTVIQPQLEGTKYYYTCKCKDPLNTVSTFGGYFVTRIADGSGSLGLIILADIGSSLCPHSLLHDPSIPVRNTSCGERLSGRGVKKNIILPSTCASIAQSIWRSCTGDRGYPLGPEEKEEGFPPSVGVISTILADMITQNVIPDTLDKSLLLSRKLQQLKESGMGQLQSLEGATRWSLLLNGDLAYTVGNVHTHDYTLFQLKQLTRHLPSVLAFGNHDDQPHHSGDCGALTRLRFPTPLNIVNGVPMDADRFARSQLEHPHYIVDNSPVIFIVLNTGSLSQFTNSKKHTHISPFQRKVKTTLDKMQQAMAQKLRMLLRGLNRTASPWVVVVGHIPMYSTQRDFGTPMFVENFRKACERYLLMGKVNLAIWAHAHQYERHCPASYAKCADRGVPHVVVGTGGHSLHALGRKDDTVVTRFLDFGYGRLVANHTSLSFRFVNRFGEVKDKFEMTRPD